MTKLSYPEVAVSDLRVGHLAFVRDGHQSDWVRILHIDDQDDITGVTAEGNKVSFRPEHVSHARRGLCAEDYKRALRTQDSCNGVALALSLGDITPLILSESFFLNAGTDWVTNHPITRLYLHQLAYIAGMTGMDPSDYNATVDDCQKRLSALDPESNIQEHEQPKPHQVC